MGCEYRNKTWMLDCLYNTASVSYLQTRTCRGFPDEAYLGSLQPRPQLCLSMVDASRATSTVVPATHAMGVSFCEQGGVSFRERPRTFHVGL